METGDDGMRVPSSRQPTRDIAPQPSGYPDNAGTTHGCEFELHVSNQNDVSCAYPYRRPARWPRFPTRPDQGMARRELRRKRMGAEKSGVGAASDAARQLFPSEGLGQGDARTKPIFDHRDRASTNRPFARERRAGVAGAPSGDQSSAKPSVPVCCSYRPPGFGAKPRLRNNGTS